MEAYGLSRTIKSQTFDTFQATEKWQIQLKEAVAQYAKSPDGWMMIGGQPGSGKTHLCTAVCREILLRGESLLYMPWREYIGKLKALNTDPGERFALLDKCKQTPWLYIDDLFKTGKNQENKAMPTATDINLAFEILNYRYNNPHAITILSSESTLDEIIRIDEATGSRIGERAGKYSISLTGNEKNYRLKKMNKAG
jgi:DNA replication protein DnaC